MVAIRIFWFTFNRKRLEAVNDPLVINMNDIKRLTHLRLVGDLDTVCKNNLKLFFVFNYNCWYTV